MPLFREIQTPEARIGIWKVTETADELFALHPKGACLKQEAETKFNSTKRIYEFAATRLLLHTLGCEHSVVYHPSGRPFLLGSDEQISISHTKGYVAVMWSSRHEVGLDIEAYSERILRLKSRIVSPQEQAETAYDVLLHWSAKESVFKIMGVESVDFLQHLMVIGWFNPEKTEAPLLSHHFQMQVSHPLHSHIYTVHYWLHDDFVLTHTVRKP